MNIEFFNKEKLQYNLIFLSQELRMFMPEITNNFVKDKNKFSLFWSKINKEKKLLVKKKVLSKKNIYDINEFSNLIKKIFLNIYSIHIYKEITDDLKKYIRVEDLCKLTNSVVPFLLPSDSEIEDEKKLFLKDKEGLEKQYGIFLSSILKNKVEGIHLCKAMLLPTKLSKDKFEEFDKKKKSNS